MAPFSDSLCSVGKIKGRARARTHVDSGTFWFNLLWGGRARGPMLIQKPVGLIYSGGARADPCCNATCDASFNDSM